MKEAHAEPELCGSCGQPIPAWSVAGNCPACLMRGRKKKDAAPAREKVGGWEIGEPLGEGAFGVVYRAKREGSRELEGAIKILRPALLTPETRNRFEIEWRSLAQLDHPDIVKILDAGTTEDGRPFFVMEYLDGQPLTDLSRTLSFEEKVDLFERVCAVVEHAHRRGIIHRDLKPENILVSETGDTDHPFKLKLLDFGLAKATEDFLTEDTSSFTRQGQILGTPEYMSPEQAGESDIDTRTDIYSLGILLFEMLADRPPFRLKSNAAQDVLAFFEHLRKTPPPSLSSIASEPIPRELDWIVAHAIAPDREQRYATVSEFRNDLVCFRENRPVLAGPPDKLYNIRKFLLRHRKTAIAAALLTVSILSATAISVVMAIRAHEADQETRAAYSQSDFRAAVDALDRNRIAESTAALARAVRTDPENRLANRLLHSILDRYEFPRLLENETLDDFGLKFWKETPDGLVVFVTEDGNLATQPPSFEDPVRVPGSNHLVIADATGKRLAVSNLQGGIYLIDLGKDPVSARVLLERENKPSSEMAFSNTGDRLYTASRGGTVRGWDGASGELLWSHQPGIVPLSLAVSVGDSHLAVGYQSGVVEFLDAETGEKSGPDFRLSSQVDHLFALSQNEFACLLRDGTSARLKFSVGGKPNPRTIRGPVWNGAVTATDFDRERQLIAIGTESEVILWNTSRQAFGARWHLDEAALELAFHPVLPRLAIGTFASGVHLWDFDHHEVVACQLHDAKNPVVLQFSEDGRELAIGLRQGSLRRYQFPAPESESAESPANRDSALPHGWDRVALANRLRLVDPSPEIPDLTLPPDAGLPVFVGRNGDWLFGAFRNEGLLAWDLASETREARTFLPREGFVRCADIDPTGRWLAFTEAYGATAVINLEDEKRQPFTLAHDRAVSSIVFSPSEPIVATSSFDGVTKLWDFRTGKAVRSEMRHDGGDLSAPHHARFSDDGGWLVTWGKTDRSFRVWNTASGNPAGAPIATSGEPVLAGFQALPGESVPALFTLSRTRNDRFRAELWSITESTPIAAPRIFAEPVASLPVPEATPFDPVELDLIQQALGKAP